MVSCGFEDFSRCARDTTRTLAQRMTPLLGKTQEVIKTHTLYTKGGINTMHNLTNKIKNQQKITVA